MGLCEDVVCVCCFEVCRTSKLALKGFNFVSGKVLFGYAESRFAKPRSSLRGRRVYSFRLYEKNGEYPRGLRTSGLRGRFKALSEILLEILPAARAEPVFRTNGGEKALNRCEVPALQRKDLGRTAKEQPCSLQTVGYGWVRICGVCGGKGLLGMVIKERLCKRNAFGL